MLVVQRTHLGFWQIRINAHLAELVDALVLEASIERCASSSLAVGTMVIAGRVVTTPVS